LYTTQDWVDNGDPDQDLGAIVINRAVGALTGWFGYSAAGNCNFHLAQLYHNASYPAATCSFELHTGTTMYYWNGAIDNCVGNRFRLETSAGCTNAIWGGQNGSGLFYIGGGGTPLITAVTSSSDQATEAFYTRLDQAWIDFTDNTIIPAARGNNFDLQALQLDATSGSVEQGDDVSVTHLAVNATNGAANQNFVFRAYLSTNSSITPSDTFLGEFGYNAGFPPMSLASIGPAVVTIPANTPPGDYFLGVRYNDDTDGYFSNNATNTWDAFPLHVSEPGPPTPPPPCFCPLDCLIRVPSGMPEGIRKLLPAGMDPLAFVHQFRDDVMAGSPLGQRYISLYYEHGTELSQLLTQQPAVGRRSMQMLGRITPNLVRIMEGSSVTLSAADRRAALELIKLVDFHASPKLRTALTEVRGDLLAGKLDRMFQSDQPSQRQVLSAVVLRWTGISLILCAGLMALCWRRRLSIAAR
jgi:hypothetical protein